MADLILLEQLHAYLIAQGAGQHPSAAPSLTIPSVWMVPRDGAPLPRVDPATKAPLENITITLVDTHFRSPSTLELSVEETFVDVIIRSRQPGAGKLVQRAIKSLLAPVDATGGRWQWMMGALLVELSTEWRGDQPLPQRQSIGESDPHVTYDRVASYRFQCRRKVLAGLSLP
ncbi:MAG TPA: hypothetical protein VFG87_15220 [Amycolatopsis sp.]|jgi:hypothetical protein|nr:hypothetical protein [Amycolatopsis sp.]